MGRAGTSDALSRATEAQRFFFRLHGGSALCGSLAALLIRDLDLRAWTKISHKAGQTDFLFDILVSRAIEPHAAPESPTASSKPRHLRVARPAARSQRYDILKYTAKIPTERRPGIGSIVIPDIRSCMIEAQGIGYRQQ